MMTFTTDERDVPVIFGIFDEVDRISRTLSCCGSFFFLQASSKKKYGTILRLKRHSQDTGAQSWETGTEFPWKMTHYQIRL